MLLALDEPGPAPSGRPLRVGLLGGSFNPAHEGHLYVSRVALERLGLDQVWWLVSPQNPLKPRIGMAPFEERLASARAIARHPRIKVLDLERRFGTVYTVDLLRRLCRWRGYRFVLLLGADNLAQLPRWRRWVEILERVPVAVVARLPYSRSALAGPAAKRFAAARIQPERARELPERAPPAWVFLPVRPHPASSTAIREGRWPRPAPRRE
ncbi:MAG: nicotinate-nucleotide adenylyltransferase [Geminicoccaceae bacterium]|nr:nicotinate-nucleotide adenylyltransferase [Geminicoccaceae bacterium]MCX7629499.1 nicotinate-nucleotide adenylyltransferase [Geminicoccaceae bacterium]MDW8339964.1 nicotinate-nucleotide adenylyltransferase [Geminicoccaceae bacterium]